MCNDTTVSKLKNDFHYTLSKFSHELRNPLTLINSGLQMIASAHPEVKEYEHWDDVMDNLDYVKELLDELSAFNNAGHVKRENIDTCSYLRTILSSIKPTLDYLEITLETDIPDSLPSMALDRIRVRQMLLNLLKNAWEAVPIPGGKISFSVIPENSGIRIDRNLKGTAGYDISAIFYNQRIRDRPWPCCFKTDRSGTQWRHHA